METSSLTDIEKNIMKQIYLNCGTCPEIDLLNLNFRGSTSEASNDERFHQIPIMEQRKLPVLIGVSVSTISRALKTLESKGLLKRRQKLENARINACYLTSDGLKLMIESFSRQKHGKIIQNISEKDKKFIQSLLSLHASMMRTTLKEYHKNNASFLIELARFFNNKFKEFVLHQSRKLEDQTKKFLLEYFIQFEKNVLEGLQ